MASTRCRLRELLPNRNFGRSKPGPKNSLTDVEGVLHTQSILAPASDNHGPINTGVTTVLPRADFFHQACYRSMFRLDGSGEFTGSHWLAATGLLHSPVVLTNFVSVGAAYTGIYEYCIPRHRAAGGEIDWFLPPVVGETFNGIMNDIGALAAKSEVVVRGIDSVSSDAVPEGIRAAGRGGIGSASRLVPSAEPAGKENYTIGVLVQANYGRMHDLRIGGAPTGRLLQEEALRAAAENPDNAAASADVAAMTEVDTKKDKKDGSITQGASTIAYESISDSRLCLACVWRTFGLSSHSSVGLIRSHKKCLCYAPLLLPKPEAKKNFSCC
ncbi:peptidase family S58-domain-containing protein [Mycena crocata]|nr:peptidase family S58-domain-containing protein [Mycena crocata]